MINTSFNKSIIALLLLSVSGLSYAQTDDPLELVASANLSFDSYLESKNVQSQSEVSLFLDAIHLEKMGIGIGYIFQNQGLNNIDNINNDIMHFNVWFSGYPEMLPGKLSITLNYYNGSEASRGISGNSGGAPTLAGKPGTTSAIDFTDSLEIINPVLSFINYSKSFYMDIGYASSKYKTSDTSVGNLEVIQWSPAIGFAFNDKYDWLQLRQYNIELSNDARTPGVSNTSASTLSWTHWLKKENNETLDNITITVLTGERLYAVDHDIKKIFNLTNMQTRSYIIGGNWKKTMSNNFYVYVGYEQYKDVTENSNYNSLFVYTGITTRW